MLTPSEAAEILLLRRRARASMVDYVSYLDLGFVPAAHHRLMCSKLDAVARGEISKIIIEMPPGSAKSTYSSMLFPCFFLGNNPSKSILACSHTQSLADRFGRKARNLFLQPHHSALFNTTLAQDSKAASYWSTDKDGEYFAAGVGVAISGRRADIGLIDDPHPNRQEADSVTAQERVWDWYLSDFLPRLKPNAGQILIQCMTGDTPVTMSDGSWKKLKDIEKGDIVLTKEADNSFGHRAVMNWMSQGEDKVFEVRTGNSKVKGNARHPFLVYDETINAEKWIPLCELKIGDLLVTACSWESMYTAILSDKEAWLLGFMFGDGWVTLIDGWNYDRKRNKNYPKRGYATCVAVSKDEEENDRVVSLFEDIFGIIPKLTNYGYRRTDIARIGRWFRSCGLTGKAKTKRLPIWLFSQPLAVRENFLEGFNKADGNIVQSGAGKGRWRMASVNEELVRDIRQLTRSCGYAVSNISIYELKDIKAPNSPEPIDSQIVDFQFNPWSRKERATFRTVAVRSIKEVGIEEVFDLQIEGTECFIADGLVVHNTRWHERDLAGRILEREGDEWEVLELPMEAYENDLLGRTPGDRLWPEWFTDKMVETAKKDVRSWTSEYQQRPVSDEGDYFKLNWFSEYEQIPDNAHYYGASDYAVTEGHGDFTEHGIFALDSFGNIYMVDWWRGQTSSDIWVERQCDLIQEYQPLIWFGESGVIRRSIEPYLVLRMTERSAMCRIEWLPSMHDKGVRLRSFSALASHGKVFFPKNAAWKAELLTQLTHFPGGRYDDGVDVCSLLGRGLDLVRAPRMKKWTRSDATSSVSNMSPHSWMVS